MHLPPPVNLTPKRVCPGCRLLTPLKRRECVRCGNTVSESDLENVRRRHARKRRKNTIMAAVILKPLAEIGAAVQPLLLIFLTMLFQLLDR